MEETRDLFRDIVDFVIDEIRPDFESEGIDESVLIDMQKMWETELMHTGTLAEMPPPAPPPGASASSASAEATNSRPVQVPSNPPASRVAPLDQQPPPLVLRRLDDDEASSSSFSQNDGADHGAGVHDLDDVEARAWLERTMTAREMDRRMLNDMRSQPIELSMELEEDVSSSIGNSNEPKLDEKADSIILQLDGAGGALSDDDDDDDDSDDDLSGLEDGVGDDSGDDSNQAPVDDTLNEKRFVLTFNTALKELGSDDDDPDEDAEPETDNLILCQYDKVTRVRNRWRCVLKDGVMKVNERDQVFKKANGVFEFHYD